MLEPWWQGLALDLQDRQAQHLLRRLRVCASAPGPVVELDGKRVVQFSNNDYLGLATHLRVIQAAQAAADRWGTGAGASPLVSGHLQVHAELEAALAKSKGAEAALVYAAGSLANLGAMSALVGPEDQVFLDKLDHATLYDGARLSGAALARFPHQDLSRLEGLLRVSRGSGSHRIVVAVDAVYSMDGDIAPLPQLLELCERYGAGLLVDEAHSTGVLGEKGHGLLEHFGIQAWPKPLVLTGTLSKALGAQGGFVAASQLVVDSLVNRSRSYIYATALSPMSAAAALEALAVVQEEPQVLAALRAGVFRMNAGLQKLGWLDRPSETPIFPLVVGPVATALQLQERLWDEGFFVPAIRPPTVPANACRLRLSLSALHEAQHIDGLLAVLGVKP